MKMPISKGGVARYRGPTSSNEYNVSEDNKYYDLLELYKQVNDEKQSLQEIHSKIVSEHFAMKNYIQTLEARLMILEKATERLDEKDIHYNEEFSKTAIIDDMTTTYPLSAQDDANDNSRCEIDYSHRFVTIPTVNEISKTYMLDKKGNPIVPEEMKVRVGRTNTGGTVIENNIKNAFDQNKLTCWKREVVYDYAEAPDKEDVIIEIELPLNIVNNLNVNTLTIHPHPENGIEIKNIEMHYNDSWKQVSGFKQEDISHLDLKRLSPKRKWSFANVPVSKVRITLVQHHSISLEGKKVFVLGAQNIKVSLSQYDSSGAFILSRFDMSEVGIYNIEEVNHNILNQEAFSLSHRLNELKGSVYDYQLLKESNGYLVELAMDEWSNQTAKTLWIKTNLYPDPNNKVNPCLNAIEIKYTKS